MDLAKVTIKVDADLSDVRNEFEEAEDQAARSGRQAANKFNRGLSRAGSAGAGGVGGLAGRRGGIGGFAVAGLAGAATAAGTLGIAAAAGFGLAGTALFGFLDAAYEASVDGKRAEAGLKNVRKQMGFTGKAYKGAQKELVALAETTSLATGVQDDLIMSAQTTLATFEGLGRTMNQRGGMFDRATYAALDLAAAGFGTVESNAVQLGKALNSPTKGMTALTRSGVTFTAAEQKKIKALEASGDLLGAQTILIEAVEKQVGGTAVATATATGKMAVAWDQFLGKAGDEVKPAIDGLVDTITTSLIPAVGDLWVELAPTVSTWIESFGEWLKGDGQEAIEGFFRWASTDGVQWAQTFASAVAGAASFIGDMATSIGLANQAIADTAAADAARRQAEGKPAEGSQWFQNLGSNIVLGAKNAPGFFMSALNDAGRVADDFVESGRWKNPYSYTPVGWVSGVQRADELLTQDSSMRRWTQAAGAEYARSQQAEEARRRWELTASTRRSQIPAMAKGGYVTSPTLALIGEAGPEYVLPENRLRSMGGGDVNVSVTVEGNGDAQAIKKAVREALDETMRRGALRLVTAGGY